MNKKILLCLSFFLLSGCSAFMFSQLGNQGGSQSNLIANSKKKFKLTDKAGEFVVYKENGFKKSNKTYISKREVLPFNDDKSKVLEQSVVISQVGRLGKNLQIMRPYQSQYSVWFDGKKYTSRISLDKKKKALVVKLTSPEKQWNGVQSYAFPDTKSVYCFFYQIIECAAMTGYFGKSLSKKKGQMNFYIIWGGYPYFQEQYLNVPDELFSRAKLNFDGLNRNGEKRFSLSFGGQVIFYLLDKNNNFIKQFWVSQGMTMAITDL